MQSIDPSMTGGFFLTLDLQGFGQYWPERATVWHLWLLDPTHRSVRAIFRSAFLRKYPDSLKLSFTKKSKTGTKGFSAEWCITDHRWTIICIDFCLSGCCLQTIWKNCPMSSIPWLRSRICAWLFSLLHSFGRLEFFFFRTRWINRQKKNLPHCAWLVWRVFQPTSVLEALYGRLFLFLFAVQKPGIQRRESTAAQRLRLSKLAFSPVIACLYKGTCLMVFPVSGCVF